MRALADTIDENLEALNGIVIELLTHNSSLATEAHRVWVDLREGIADLRGEYKDEEKTKCNCDKCECDNSDDYTEEGDTCENCFSNCLTTEGGLVNG